MIVPKRSLNAREVYRCAVVLRVAFVFIGSGYVHPDEYFQSSEIAARDVLNVTAFTPWEFGGNSTTGILMSSVDFPPFV